MKILNKIFTITISSILIINCALLMFFIYETKNVENILRVLAILFLFFLIIYFIIKTLEIISSNKKTLKIKIIFIIISLILLFINFNTFKLYNYIKNVSNKIINYTSVVISKNSNGIENIKDSKIGLLLDEESMENFIIPKEIIKDFNLDSNNEIEYFENINELINALNTDEIDYVITSINYNSFFDEPYEFEEIYRKSKSEESKISQNSKIEKPITILLLGIDSEREGLNNAASFHSDTIILITFNPKTFNSTILSIPRDTFVPISCINNKYSKITHSGLYGEQCVIKTLENLTNIKIDHFVKMNFKGLVDLVEALGGINVDVPYAFCEQNSNRSWGKNIVYVEKGYQKLNGEQALALSRNRKTNSDVCEKKYTLETRNDFIRNQNQQKVISSILNEMKNIKSISQVHSILEVIENNTHTSFNSNEILSFYNIGKDIFTYNPTISFEQLYLSGYDKYIYDDMVGLTLYNYVYYKESLNDITQEMKINLELEDPTLIKEFYFSQNEPYKKITIGKDNYSEAQVKTLPNFLNKNVSEVTSYTTSNNINLTIENKTTENTNLNNIVFEQSIPSNYLLSKVKNLTVKVYKYEEPIIIEEIEE